jgi:hypothetical protein
MTTTDTDLVDIDDITPDEELVAEMRKARVTTPLTRVLLGLVVVALAFLAGAYMHRWQNPSSGSSTNPQDFLAQLRGAAGDSDGTTGGSLPTGFPGGGGGGGLGGGGGNTIGTVKLVDGTTVYVEDASGNITRITTDAKTDVTLSTDASVDKLKPGTSVIVQGEAGADGEVAATSIAESSGFGGGGFGAPPNAGG